MSSTPIKVLLLGGHGKVALHFTRQLLSSPSQAYHITSVIRNPDHTADILGLAEEAKRQGGGPGSKVETLVQSLEECRSLEDAKTVLEKVGPEWVVWSAGAGGKPPASRTFLIDRDACKHYITASLLHSPTVRKFLLVSYTGSRRNKAPWWSDSEWTKAQEINNTILKNYYQAKVDADEWLVATADKARRTTRSSSSSSADPLQAICLRPGALTDAPAAGSVVLGHTKASGSVSRADVADVAVRLLERGDSKGWIDLLGPDGGGEEEEETGKAVERVCREGIDCFEGEDRERILGLVD